MRAVERFGRIISTMLLTAGLVVLLDVGLTLVWKEPVSTVYGSIRQAEASSELDRLRGEFPTRADLDAISGVEAISDQAQILARRFKQQVTEGEAIGRIRIPSIGADYVVVEGTETAPLRKGPGRYPETSMPGQGATVAIAGHRTTYLAPFRRIDDIEPGDRIVLEMPYASFSYRMERHRIVTPDRVEVVRDVDHERLVLTACHPLYSAAERYVIFARLESISMFAAPDGVWQDP